MGQPVIFTKSLAASSSNTLGSFSSAAVTAYTTGSTASVTTSSGAVGTVLDTGRRISIWSTAADQTSLLITITGLSEGGGTIDETVLGASATGALRTTFQDFLGPISLSFSSFPLEGRVHVATSSKGGTPWKAVDTWAKPFGLTAVISMTTSSNSALANFECTLEDITQTVPGPLKYLSSTPTTPVLWYPTPFISQVPGSTLISTTGDLSAQGYFTSPISAWRVTLTSSSSTASTMGVSVLQSG